MITLFLQSMKSNVILTKAMEWIKTKKELPEVEKHVVICQNYGTKDVPVYRYNVAQLFSNKKKFIHRDGVIDVHDVLCWFYIPELNNN